MAARAAHTKSMGESTRLEKNRRIAKSQKETRERRENKDILVRTVKIQRNKLSHSQLEALERLFLEGKWLYNTALAHSQFDEEFRRSLDNTVEVKLPRVTVLKRNVATTATCVCGVKTPHNLSQRKFECPSCGYSAPRDIHAAQNMFLLATPDNIKINGYGT